MNPVWIYQGVMSGSPDDQASPSIQETKKTLISPKYFRFIIYKTYSWVWNYIKDTINFVSIHVCHYKFRSKNLVWFVPFSISFNSVTLKNIRLLTRRFTHPAKSIKLAVIGQHYSHPSSENLFHQWEDVSKISRRCLEIKIN